MKKLGIAIAGAALILGGTVGMGMAQGRTVDVEIDTAPPADRVEVAPAPRSGYVYERGHYAWDGHEYVWTEGQFIEERPGHIYTQPEIEHRGEHYYFHHGHWDDD